VAEDVETAVPVVDIMDALKESLERAKKAQPKDAKKKSPRKKKAARASELSRRFRPPLECLASLPQCASLDVGGKQSLVDAAVQDWYRLAKADLNNLASFDVERLG